MFGYNNLVVDFRNLIDMKTFGYPVCMDVTHSTQRPGGLDGKSGGNREYAPYLAAAAAAVGVKGFFFEVHENPDQALSDGPNMIPLHEFKNLLLNSVLRHAV
jgi:2-dehydro-3-deoxyphosphooctonate aldolase (KDO 8-P synthase)